jgi:hypothetical protein
MSFDVDICDIAGEKALTDQFVEAGATTHINAGKFNVDLCGKIGYCKHVRPWFCCLGAQGQVNGWSRRFCGCLQVDIGTGGSLRLKFGLDSMINDMY